MRAPARVPRSSPDHDQGARSGPGRLLHPGQGPGAGAVCIAAGPGAKITVAGADRAHGAAGGSRLHRPAAAQAPCVATGGVTPHAGDIGGHRIVGKRPGPAPRCRLACPAVRMGALHPAGGDEAVGDTRIPGTGPGSPDSRFFCPGLMPLLAPHPECIDQRAAPAAPRLETNARRLAVDPVLDGVDRCDQRQRPGGLAASPSPGGWRHGPRRRRCHRRPACRHDHRGSRRHACAPGTGQTGTPPRPSRRAPAGNGRSSSCPDDRDRARPEPVSRP